MKKTLVLIYIAAQLKGAQTVYVIYLFPFAKPRSGSYFTTGILNMS